MPIEIRMPALSPTMEEGTLAKWLVAEGDSVSAGDMIAEIETDKATMEVESIDDGTVGKLVVKEGTEAVPVGGLIAVLLTEGEDNSALEGISDRGERAPGGEAPPSNMEMEPKKQEKSAKEAAPKSAEDKKETETRPDAAQTAGEGDSAPPPPQPPAKSQGNGHARDGARVFASPLARRMAEQEGLEIGAIAGSGPEGRVVKRDVVKALESGAAKAPVEPEVARGDKVIPEGGAPYEEVKLSGMRKVIARRMTESKQTVPHYYLTTEVEIDRLLAQRKEVNEGLDDHKVSVNDYIIMAVGRALQRVPDVNVQFAGDKLRRFSRADVSVAVAVEGGLLTPVIRGAEEKSLLEISHEMKALADKAHAGKLMPEEYQGGNFSISNLGMFGVSEFSAVINPPESGILAIGAGIPRPVVRDGSVTTRTIMKITASFDHRAVDGATGAKFLAEVRRLLEDPLQMLI